MVLRKITVDNSVRYIPKSEQTKDIKQTTTKNKKTQPILGGGKQKKNFQKIIKNLLKILQLVDLVYLQNSICTSIIILFE